MREAVLIAFCVIITLLGLSTTAVTAAKGWSCGDFFSANFAGVSTCITFRMLASSVCY